MTTIVKNRNSNHFIDNVRHVILRGGRIAKHRGQVMSFAPMLGTMAVALMSSASVMLMGTSAVAGTCTETSGGSGIWTCTGPANTTTDTTQTPTAATGGALTVSTTAGFGINPALGKAFVLNSIVGQTNITFTDTNSSAITGGGYGISAYNHGTGTTSVTTTGTVHGNGSLGIGMYVANASTATNLTVSAASVTGAIAGIIAKNYGTGATSVTAVGAVSSASMASGIYANNSGTTLTVSAAGVSGGTNGIYAKSTGTGTMSVTASGTVTGGTYGIKATNSGGGATSVTASGTVTGTSKDGIHAKNSVTSTSTGLTISTAAVTGGSNGIWASGYGSGATSVTATGAVTGTTLDGIFAFSAFGSGLTVSAAAVTGGKRGIHAFNNNNSAITVIATGLVQNTAVASTFGALYVGNTTTGTDMTVSAAAVTGDAYGIKAYNKGIGATSVTATGTVTGGASMGIDARSNNSGATNLTVSAVAVAGGTYGISARNLGAGATSVTATGLVTGTNYDGIYAYNNGTNLTVSAVAVAGGTYGISAQNFGAGATSVTATGLVTGTNYDGIYAYNGATASNLTVSAVAVTGGTNGIDARNFGAGATSVTATGAVTGGTGYGINTVGANTTITLNAGAAVSSTAGKGILNGVGNSSITVNTGASVAGKIVLGAGSDNLTFAGGASSAVTLFDGGIGVGTDVLSFVGSSATLVGANVTNWENVTVGSGSTVSFSDNALTAGTLTVASGGTLNAFGGNLAVTGNLTNSGTVKLQNGTVGDASTVSGNYVGGGALLVDVNTTLDTADTLAIAGNSSGTTLITVNNLTPLVGTGNDITLVTVAGTSVSTNFALSGGAITAGAFNYDIKYAAGSFVLGNSLNSTGATYLATPEILSGFNHMQSMEQRIDGRAQRPGQAAWISLHGYNSKATMTSGSNTSSNSWGVQVGTDLEFDQGDAGRWVLGVAGQYGSMSSAVAAPFPLGTGNIATTGYGLGLSATWYSNDGTYVDAQGQMNWLSSDISSSLAGPLVKGHASSAYALSMEAGHRFILGTNSAIVPQVQITRGNINGGSFTDSVGNSVNLSSNSSTIGRVGVAYEFARKDANKFYVIGNVMRDFSNNSSVTVGTVNLNTAVANPTTVEIGFGGTQNFGNMEIYGEAGVRTALGSTSAKNNTSFGGTLGLRIKF